MSDERIQSLVLGAFLLVGFLIYAGGIFLVVRASPPEVRMHLGLALGFICFTVVALMLRLWWLARRHARGR